MGIFENPRDESDDGADVGCVGPAPDDFMDTPIPHLFRLSAKSYGRTLQFLDMKRQGNPYADFGLAKEDALRWAYDSALRIRAWDMANWIADEFGYDTIEGDLQDDGCRYCWSVCLLDAIRRTA